MIIEGGADAKINYISNRKDLVNSWENYTIGVEKDGAEFEGGTRSVLKKYYNHLLGKDVVARAIATKNWFRWEMGVSSFDSTSQIHGKDEVPVGDLIIWNPSARKWLGKDGEVYAETVESLRRWPQNAQSVDVSSSASTHRLPSERTLSYDATNLTKADAARFVPAQAMLTCYYSVNDAYMMSHFQLLAKENIDRIRHIPCIAV